MELVKSFKISSFFLGRWLKGGLIGPSDIWTVSASASKTPRFPVVGYDKHLAVIRRNMESPIGWPYYHNSVMGDGNLTDLRGRVSALDIQDNLETNEKKEDQILEMIRYRPWFLFSKATSGSKISILLHTNEKKKKCKLFEEYMYLSLECNICRKHYHTRPTKHQPKPAVIFLLKQYISSMKSKRCLWRTHVYFNQIAVV